MAKFKVKGALRETAEDIEVVIEASSYKEAERAANKMGILVNDVLVEEEPKAETKTVERVIQSPEATSENYFSKKRTSFNQVSGCLKIVIILIGLSCIIGIFVRGIGDVANEPAVNRSSEETTNAWRDVPPELLRNRPPPGNRPPPEVRRERDQDESAKTQVVGIWREYIGWSDTGSDWVDWKISKASSGYEMAIIVSDGTGMTFELLRSDSHRGERFKPVGKMLGTYLILNSMGNLERWDADGNMDELAPRRIDGVDDQDESAKTQVMGIWREYIGWSDTGSDWVDWKISKASSGYEMAMSAYDGTGMTFELLRSDSPRGEIFKPVGKMLGTYWILNSMGNLEGWDADGKIDELAPK